MRSQNYLPDVRKQYEDYPFPRVDPGDETWRLQVMPQDHLPNINHMCWGGRRDSTKGLRILVAGGGTGHALIYLAEQLRHTDSEIVYLDLSQASQKVARERAMIRGLTNIEWRQGSILDLPEMGLEPFDYINCTGVLHHLESPVKGLKALDSVLAEDGVMGLMVYAKYGRQSYYHVQEMMRQINEPDEHPESKIRNTKAAMLALPQTFFLGHGIHRDKHLEGFFGDHINLYDTFLHSQDRAYTVPEIYDWVESCGLEMNGFTNFNPTMRERVEYWPELYIQDEQLLERVLSYPLRKRQAIAELLSTKIGLHTFYASKRIDTEAQLDDLEQVPFFTEIFIGGESAFSPFDVREAAAWLRVNPGKTLEITHPNQVTMGIHNTPHAASLLVSIDGERTVGQILERVQQEAQTSWDKPTRATLLDEFGKLYQACSELEWMRLRHVSVPAYPSYRDFQDPVSENYRVADEAMRG